jgi:hypothetical protein
MYLPGPQTRKSKTGLALLNAVGKGFVVNVFELSFRQRAEQSALKKTRPRPRNRSDCDGTRAVSGARRIRVANPPTANDQMASLSSFEARKATFLLALI